MASVVSRQKSMLSLPSYILTLTLSSLDKKDRRTSGISGNCMTRASLHITYTNILIYSSLNVEESEIIVNGLNKKSPFKQKNLSQNLLYILYCFQSFWWQQKKYIWFWQMTQQISSLKKCAKGANHPFLHK